VSISRGKTLFHIDAKKSCKNKTGEKEDKEEVSNSRGMPVSLRRKKKVTKQKKVATRKKTRRKCQILVASLFHVDAKKKVAKKKVTGKKTRKKCPILVASLFHVDAKKNCKKKSGKSVSFRRLKKKLRQEKRQGGSVNVASLFHVDANQ
jgi:hypothetical protein